MYSVLCGNMCSVVVLANNQYSLALYECRGIVLLDSSSICSSPILFGSKIGAGIREKTNHRSLKKAEKVHHLSDSVYLLSRSVRTIKCSFLLLIFAALMIVQKKKDLRCGRVDRFQSHCFRKKLIILFYSIKN